jgi:hypothetical protein
VRDTTLEFMRGLFQLPFKGGKVMHRPLFTQIRNEPGKATDDKQAKEESKYTSEAKTEAEAETETKEIGGPKGKEPTRFGDWEKNGRISDF